MGRVPNDRAHAHAEAQRERILTAAQQCFVEHGFHAAGMAKIAEAAEMSPGLIYRYFENKGAIIQAIVERQLALVRADIHLDRPVDLADEMLARFDATDASDPKRLSPALLLELSAEASRDPQIAAAVGSFDTDLRHELGEWLQRRVAARTGRPLDPARAQSRALMLQMVFEAVIVRAAREPGLDRELLADAVRRFVALILDEADVRADA
jgi:AcrR family transcriptional regulator